MTEEKDKCDTCEHRGDSSNEYCGSCGGGVESNWKEAGWSKDKTINELRTRVADWRADAVKHAQEVLELRARLSTLLKASEGMEKALERISHIGAEKFQDNSMWMHQGIAVKSLDDFRAVKENSKKD